MHMIKVALACLAAVATVAAKCAYSGEGHGFEMYIYGQTNCGTADHYEEFYGAGDSCQCFKIAAALKGKVKSFVYTASSLHSINIFQGVSCNGTLLGTSVGNWIDSTVSTNGQKMTSFEVCLY